MKKSESRTELWCVSDYNFLKEVKAGLALPKRVTLCDLTIREGEETAGVVLRLDEAALIARRLDEARIPQIQIGRYAAGVIKQRRELGIKAKTEVLAGSTGKEWKKSIDAAIDLGVDIIEILHSLGYRQHRYEEKLSNDGIISRVVEQVEYAKARGVVVGASPMDGTRTDLNFLLSFYKAAVDAGADRVRVYDTVGTVGPHGMRYLVRKVKEAIPKTPVGVHCHNDFGQGMANLFAAVEAGAEIIDVTVNGIGQRLGNPPLAEVATALKVLYGIDSGVKLEKMYELSKLVEDLTRFPIHKTNPLVGELAFSGMAGGIGTLPNDGLDPKAVGNSSRTILWKLNVNEATVKTKLKELGISVPEDKVSKIVEKIAEESEVRKRSITDEEIRRIVELTTKG